MTQYVIEKGVPVVDSRGRPNVYPFGQMEIGDSFFASKDTDKSLHMNTVRRAASAWATRHGVKMIVRKVEGGVRIWRVA